MKHSIAVFLAMALLVMACAAGCANEPAPGPSAAPTDDQGLNGGTGSAAGEGTGDASGAGLGTESGSGTGAGMGSGSDMNGGTGSGMGDGTTSGVLISDFSEGKEIHETDVPEIVAALQERYEGATINRIAHVMHNGQQAYEVQYSTQDGVLSTAYIGADGQFLPDGNSGGADGSDSGLSGTGSDTGSGGNAGNGGAEGATGTP